MRNTLIQVSPTRPRSSIRRGFSIVEFVVLLGILLVLVSIFVPYIGKVRESEHRAQCMDNLRKFGRALAYYADNNEHMLPSVVYDSAKRPNGYTTFTGADDPNPFAPDSTVLPNDVTASLFLLVREGYISSGHEAGLNMFICPSSDGVADSLVNAKGESVSNTQRSNFRAGIHLSYSYCCPFSGALKFRMNTDWISSDFAVMADQSPGVGNGSDVTGPPYGSAPLEMSKANSNNHNRSGQNVLYGDGHVAFTSTPFCGVEGDNIYTVAAPMPTTAESTGPSLRSTGFFGRRYGPSSWGDSYLVPSENDRD